MEIYTTHPMISRRYIKRVSPAPLHLSTNVQQQTVAVPYKTIKQEAEEFKARMRAMRLQQKAVAAAAAKPQQKPHRQKPKHPRNHRLHKEPSRFIGVLKEGWNYRIELVKYHLGVFAQNIIPTLFCLRTEVDNGAYESSHRVSAPENEQ